MATLAGELFQEWSRAAPEIVHESLHPCFIHGRAHLVTRKGLLQEFPAAYRTLLSIASKYAVTVLEDRRSRQQTVTHDKRKKIALVIGFFVGLGMKQAVMAESLSYTGMTSVPHSVMQTKPTRNTAFERGITRHLAATTSVGRGIRLGLPDMDHPEEQRRQFARILACFRQDTHASASCQQPNTGQVQQTRAVLQRHLTTDDHHAAATRAVIEEFAHYYARYPEVVSLLNQLDGRPWTLTSTPNTWESRAFLMHNRVQRVEVHFDPGTAAQMLFARHCEGNPACIVSPADALLHELLHAHLMLEQPTEFAAQNQYAIYPTQHEYAVIELENSLYQAMSRTDRLPRPLRSRHQATLISVDCPVCIPDGVRTSR